MAWLLYLLAKDKLEGGSRQNNMICIYLLLKSTKKTVLNVWLLMGGRASNERTVKDLQVETGEVELKGKRRER